MRAGPLGGARSCCRPSMSPPSESGGADLGLLFVHSPSRLRGEGTPAADHHEVVATEEKERVMSESPATPPHASTLEGAAANMSQV